MFQVSSGEKSGGGPDQPTFSDIISTINSTISSTTFDPSVGTSTTNHSGDPPGQIQPTFSDIPFHNFSIPSTTSDNLPKHSEDSLPNPVWPTLLGFPTEFKDGSWQCPFCSHSTPRIRQHLTKHKDNIKDWSAAESFCDAMAAMKRKEKLIRR